MQRRQCVSPQLRRADGFLRCMEPHTPRLTDQDVAALAAEASADPRSVIRALAGLPVRGLAGTRIREALARHRATPTPPNAA